MPEPLALAYMTACICTRRAQIGGKHDLCARRALGSHLSRVTVETFRARQRTESADFLRNCTRLAATCGRAAAEFGACLAFRLVDGAPCLRLRQAYGGHVHGVNHINTTSFQPKLWSPGDWNALFGFGTNILVNMLTLTALLRFVLKMPDSLVFGRILPAAGLMMFLSTVYYAWLAYSWRRKPDATTSVRCRRASACRTCSSSHS